MNESQLAIKNRISKEYNLEGKDLDDYDKLTRSYCGPGNLYASMVKSDETSQLALEASDKFASEIGPLKIIKRRERYRYSMRRFD